MIIYSIVSMGSRDVWYKHIGDALHYVVKVFQLNLRRTQLQTPDLCPCASPEHNLKTFPKQLATFFVGLFKKIRNKDHKIFSMLQVVCVRVRSRVCEREMCVCVYVM